MNKVELIAKIAETNDITKKKAGEMVEGVFEEIKKALVSGEDVNIPGFGKFEIVDRPAREGRNPQTGETISIDAFKALKFKVSAPLKAAVKG